MVYPDTPFDPDFNTQILAKSQSNNTDSQIQIDVARLLRWLCLPPKISSLRINTITNDRESMLDLIESILSKISNISPRIELHQNLPEVIVVHNVDVTTLDLERKHFEIVVDVHCAAAVLRGAHIFAPGVLGMQTGVKLNDKVSIYADISKKCKKGFTRALEENKKQFIGNGVAKMVRSQLFGENLNLQGVAIEVYSNVAGCPNLGLELLPRGSCLLQNLPSIVCVHVLSPKPGDVILDMCASPGNKTTHIAALMQNKGFLIAIDKTPSKVKQLQETCDTFKASTTTYQANSTNIFDEKKVDISDGPPFGSECFDKVLLDAPCSALGKRPQLYNNTSEKVLKSYVPLQRKLFENAVNLLKTNGILVYSTCTITLAENEGIVSWALKKYHCLELVKAEPHLGSRGWPGTDLTDRQLECVQRFDNNTNLDSVGFFIAKFMKKRTL